MTGSALGIAFVGRRGKNQWIAVARNRVAMHQCAANSKVTTASGTKREDARVIVVNDVRWLVYEHATAFDRRSAAALVFECDEVMRRVREFPPDWREWSDARLYELSWKI